MLVRDVMTTDLVTVSPDDSVQELARVLTDRGISGAPVLAPDGGLVGIVSEADVIGKRGSRVADVMQRTVISVPDDTPLPDVASIMSMNGINRVPITRDAALVGIVTRTDLVRAIARGRLEQASLQPEREREATGGGG